MVTQPRRIPTEKPLKWTSVGVQEVIDSNYRLKASIYGIESRQVRKDLERGRWNIVHLNAFIEDSFYGGRSKRVYIDKSNENAVGFLGSSEMLSVHPKPVKFLLKGGGTDKFALKKGQILLSRSGTIGNVNYVNSTLENYFVSEHAIRIICKEYSGYVYTFLKSKEGRVLVKSNMFGAVISQLEPEHLNHIPIPNPPPILKQKIHDLIEESFNLQDESNELMDAAQASLKAILQLPSIDALKERTKQFDKTAGVLNYSVSSSAVIDRLDGSYYDPIVKAIEQHIAKTAKEIVKVGDSRISKSIILPGRFKRVYVEEGDGVPFIGGKQIFELDPNNKKYLSPMRHENRIKGELTLRENMIVITCSGTIGKVTIVPKHWDGWTANQHIIRVVPPNDEIAGYLHAWLSSDYAYPLITRYTHGAVIDEINDVQVSEIVVPLLHDKKMQCEINDRVLEANRKRTEAYNLEQEALKVLDEKVIYAR